ncbi:MAG: hypothetical protein QM487_15890 [Candidatus Marithrix sp.]
MKYLKKIIIRLVSIPLIIIVSLELFYLYRVYEIQPKKILSDVEHTQSAIDVFWVSIGESGNIVLEPFSVTKFIYYNLFIVYINSYSISPKDIAIDLAGLVARKQLINKKYSNLN